MKCSTEHLALQNSMSNHLISLCSNILCMMCHISCPILFCSKHKMFLWFHFASKSCHGCLYKLGFLLEQWYRKVFLYIHLWFTVRSVQCQVLLQSISPALLSTSRHLYFFYYHLSSVYLNNSFTSLVLYIVRNILFYSHLKEDEIPGDKSKNERVHGLIC